MIIVASSGTSLNFKVVGGTTQPTGEENLIWVNTSAAITAWSFSATVPASPAEGMVWFIIGTNSAATFNALKKNGIWVYPTSCKQYISGAWVDKTAKTYKGGVWVDWRRYLFKAGAGLQNGASLTFLDTHPKHTVDSEKINWSDSLGNGNTFYFSPAEDLSSYSQLHFDLKCTAQYSAQHKITLGATPSVPVFDGKVPPFDAFIGGIYNTTRQTFSVDISSLAGAEYVAVYASAVLGELYNVWLD